MSPTRNAAADRMRTPRVSACAIAFAVDRQWAEIQSALYVAPRCDRFHDILRREKTLGVAHRNPRFPATHFRHTDLHKKHSVAEYRRRTITLRHGREDTLHTWQSIQRQSQRRRSAEPQPSKSKPLPQSTMPTHRPPDQTRHEQIQPADRRPLLPTTPLDRNMAWKKQTGQAASRS